MATPWLPLLSLLLAAALAPAAVDAPRAPSAVGAPRSPTAVAFPASALPAAAASGLALVPDCQASVVAAQVLLSCDPLFPTAGCCNALLGSVPQDDALPCLCAAAHDPDLEHAGYMEAGLLQLYGDCGGRLPAADDLHALCLCQEAPAVETTRAKTHSAPRRREEREVSGSCDASKLAWDVAAHCLDSLDSEQVKVPKPSCCSALFAAAESRRCFCTFLQELKVELSPISRKNAHLLHRRCGGSRPLPKCFAHRYDSQQQVGSLESPSAASSPPPPAPSAVSSPPPPAPALKHEPPAYEHFFRSVLEWVLSHAPLEAGCLVFSAAVAAALTWIRKRREERHARRRMGEAAGTAGDKVVDLGLQVAEKGLEAVAKNLQQKEQVSSPPLSAETRSRGTSTTDSCPSSEQDQEELPQQEEQACKPQVAAPAASAAKIEASGWFSLRFEKWW